MSLNFYNPYVREELELYHHGVAGQKWGQRNGPPYPLSAGSHSASEKKAGWRKSLAGGNGSESGKIVRNELKKLKKKFKQISSSKATYDEIKEAQDYIDKMYHSRISDSDRNKLITSYKLNEEKYDALEDLDNKYLDKLSKSRRISESDSVFNKRLSDIKDPKLKKAYNEYIESNNNLYKAIESVAKKVSVDHSGYIPESKNMAYRSVKRYILKTTGKIK